MSEFPHELQAITAADPTKDLFDRVWKIVQECGEEERHFNQLQSVYRGVASTWLLATLGAVGYLLFNKDTKVSDPHFGAYFFAAAICFLGAFGIGLTWVLDLRVYHRLLVAVFEEGRKLENQFAWLPRLRTNMYNIGRTRNSGRDPIRKLLAWYYVGTAGVPLLASDLFLSLHLRDLGIHWLRYLILFFLLAIALLFRFFRWTTGVPPSTTHAHRT